MERCQGDDSGKAVLTLCFHTERAGAFPPGQLLLSGHGLLCQNVAVQVAGTLETLVKALLVGHDLGFHNLLFLNKTYCATSRIKFY